MPKKTEEVEVVHEILLPDNTFAVFYHYNSKTDFIEVFLGDFASEEIKDTKEHDRLRVLATAVESGLEEAIEQSMEAIGESGRVVEKINGNVIHAIFPKRIH